MVTSRADWDKRSWILLLSGVGICLGLWDLLIDHCLWLFPKLVKIGLQISHKALLTTLLTLGTCAVFCLLLALPIIVSLTSKKLPVLWAVSPGVAFVAYKRLTPHGILPLTNNLLPHLLVASCGMALFGYGLRRTNRLCSRREMQPDAPLSNPTMWPPPPS